MRLADDDSLLAFGRLGAPHGMSGELRFTSFFRGEAALLDLLTGAGGESPPAADSDRLVWLGFRDRPAAELIATTIDSCRLQGEKILIRLATIPDRTAAEKTPRYELFLGRERLRRALGEGEFLADDLVGCEAVDVSRRALGTIIDVEVMTAQDLLVIRPASGPPFRVPFVDPLVPRLDLPARRIVLELPEGLEDLGA